MAPLTRSRLSIQSIFGQVEPTFMPEGVAPASGELQKIMVNIFGEFTDWTIVIFDNLLVLAYDWEMPIRS